MLGVLGSTARTGRAAPRSGASTRSTWRSLCARSARDGAVGSLGPPLGRESGAQAVARQPLEALALRFARREPVRLGLGIAAPLLGVALVAAGAGVVVKNGTLEQGAPGIVLEDAAELHEGPDPWSGTRGAAREGESATILETQGGCAHVRLANGREGWVRTREVGAIE